MGLVATPQEATEKRPHTPKLAFVAKPAASTSPRTARGSRRSSIDLLARIFSMGVLHHAMTGTGAVAIAAAAAIPGTIVSRVAPAGADGRVRFGHPSGSLNVGAEAREEAGQWIVSKVMMSRSARRLMEGWVRVPGEWRFSFSLRQKRLQETAVPLPALLPACSLTSASGAVFRHPSNERALSPATRSP